ALKEVGIRLRAFEAMREDEAIILPEQRRELPRDHLGVDLVRVGEKRDAVPLAHAQEQLFHPRHRAVEEVGPDGLEVAQRAAVAGPVAEEVVELADVDRAPLEVAVRAGLLEELYHLVARHARLFAETLQHPLVGELDDGVAEVEDEPGDHVADNYMRKT